MKKYELSDLDRGIILHYTGGCRDLYDFRQITLGVDEHGVETEIEEKELRTLTKGEIKTLYGGEEFLRLIGAIESAAAVEVYYSRDGKEHYHTDNLESAEGVDMWREDILGFAEMDQEEYARTVLANSSIEANFGEWYDDEGATVVVVLLRK